MGKRISVPNKGYHTWSEWGSPFTHPDCPPTAEYYISYRDTDECVEFFDTFEDADARAKILCRQGYYPSTPHKRPMNYYVRLRRVRPEFTECHDFLVYDADHEKHALAKARDLAQEQCWPACEVLSITLAHKKGDIVHVPLLNKTGTVVEVRADSMREALLDVDIGEYVGVFRLAELESNPVSRQATR
jgi:hypothetical protein